MQKNNLDHPLIFDLINDDLDFQDADKDFNQKPSSPQKGRRKIQQQIKAI